eukprot:jgi/Chlat1/1022/Chrsp109S00046
MGFPQDGGGAQRPREEEQEGDKDEELVIVHFNDVYNVEPRQQEPVGGAARFVSAVRSLPSPLVLFSGDAFGPSLLSTALTRGGQMPPVLNAAGVGGACLGNHDLDFGLEQLSTLMAECSFPWLCANILDASTMQPLPGLQRSLLLKWRGWRVGLIGLVEREWLDTLGAVEPEDLAYVDFVTEGRRLAEALRSDEGADVVIALTHMRDNNDERLAREAGDLIDLVLGGHDHHYSTRTVNNALIVKSGTDFREFTVLRLRRTHNTDAPTNNINGNGNHSKGRFSVTHERVEVTKAVPEDPQIKEVVDGFLDAMGRQLDEPVGIVAVGFASIRLRETNAGSLVCDIAREGICGAADCALFNSGTFRSDAVHGPGAVTGRDLLALLPMMDVVVLVEMSGEQLLEALENGVSGIALTFDAAKPPGSRLLRDSVLVNNAPIDLTRTYKVATKEYLLEGRDGYDVLKGCKVLVDGETGPTLPQLLRKHFAALAVLNNWHPPQDPGVARAAARFLARGHAVSSHDNKSHDGHHHHAGDHLAHVNAAQYACRPPRAGKRIVCLNKAVEPTEPLEEGEGEGG